MNDAVVKEILEVSTEAEKFASDLKLTTDEVTEEVQNLPGESQAVQLNPAEPTQAFEDRFRSEIQELKDQIRDFTQSLETFKQETSSLVEKSLTASEITQDRLAQIFEAHGLRWEGIIQIQGQLDKLAQISPERLREELITGIRLLGERVSKAIEEMNVRMDNFAHEIHEKINNNNNQFFNTISEETAIPEHEDFASLKESKLFDVNDYEIVPREAIKKLVALFKKQSSAIKNFILKHETRVKEFEQLLKTYDEENTRLLELLDRRVKRNFNISMIAVVIVIVIFILTRIL